MGDDGANSPGAGGCAVDKAAGAENNELDTTTRKAKFADKKSASSSRANLKSSEAHSGGGGGESVPKRMELSQDDIREFKEIFNLVDTDGSGAISTEELGQLVESVGMKLSQQELQEMITELDKDQSGEIEIDEFIAILCKDLALDYSADEIQNAFKMFSRNAPNGLIRMSDLEEALKVYLKKVQQSEISALLRQFEDCVVYLSQVVDADGFPVPFFRYQDYINLMMRRG